MRPIFRLAPLAACLLLVGCGKSAAPFDFVADTEFDAALASTPVLVVNFTADW